MLFNNFRFEYLMKLWKEEVYNYTLELRNTNLIKKKALAIRIEQIDEAIVVKLLKIYLHKCKFKHAFAFLQFRKILPNAKLMDLRELFNDRKEMLLKSQRTILKHVR